MQERQTSVPIPGFLDAESFGSIALVGVNEGKLALCSDPNKRDVFVFLRSTGLRVMSLDDNPDSGPDLCLIIADWP